MFMQWKSASQYENSCKTSKRHTASVLVSWAGQGSYGICMRQEYFLNKPIQNSVYAFLTPFRPRCGIHSLKVFPSLLPQISTDQLQAFCFQFLA